MRSWLPLIIPFAALVCAIAFSRDANRQSVGENPTSTSLSGKPSPSTSTQSAEPVAPVFNPLIRVKTTPRAVRQLQIAIDGPYRIQPVGNSRMLRRGKRLEEVRVVATSSGIRIGDDEFPVARLEVVATDSPAIWVDKHQYRGNVRLFRRPGNKLIAVNVLPLEDYIASVVDGEMPAAFPDAARRAQAIVARTYALYQRDRVPANALFDVHATTRSQKYLGFQYRTKSGRRLAGETSDGRRVAQQTAGMICTYQGELFCTYYSAVCGGRTTAGKDVFSDAADPLKSVPCDWCQAARRYRWTARISKTEASRHLQRHFRDTGHKLDKLQSITLMEGAAVGEPSAYPVFQVSDGRRRHRVSSVALRRNLPARLLPSPRFLVTDAGDEFEFHGRGHGHGAGMCQWGAHGLALTGKTCLDIIQYYYSGAEIAVLEP